MNFSKSKHPASVLMLQQHQSDINNQHFIILGRVLILFAGLSMNILCAGDKSPAQRSFFKNCGQFIARLKVSGRAV